MKKIHKALSGNGGIHKWVQLRWLTPTVATFASQLGSGSRLTSAWIKRPESTLQQENKQIVEQVKLIHKQSRETGPDAHIVCWSMVVLVFIKIYRKEEFLVLKTG